LRRLRLTGHAQALHDAGGVWNEARGAFLGFTYQLGNLIASVNAPLQAALAAYWGGNYGLALVLVAGIVAVTIAD
jgi:SHS family lactate transporter-like MFS transporter